MALYGKIIRGAIKQTHKQTPDHPPHNVLILILQEMVSHTPEKRSIRRAYV